MARFASSQGSSKPQDLKPQNTLTVEGATPKVTIGDAGAEDTILAFDGNAVDYRIGLDDGTDKLEIGVGLAHGSNIAIGVDSSAQVTKLNLAAAAVAVADDHIVILDGGATGAPKAESIQDLLSAIAGSGISVSGNQLVADGGGTADSVAADNISAGDAAISLATSTGNITIDAQGNNTDIIFKGTDATSDITMLTLDGSEAGAATFNSTVTATGFTIGSAAITETELEILDGASVTTTELNLLDGGTSVGGSITIGDADGFIINDGGTMKTIPASDIKTYVGNPTTFVTEDGDGTEVTIANAKQIKFVDGEGMQINFTDTDSGADGDEFDLSFNLTIAGISAVAAAHNDSFLTLDSNGSTHQRCTTSTLATLFAGAGLTATNSVIAIDAAQTGITSILATDLKIGEDDQTKIDFETEDEIHFYAANVEQVYLADNIFGPQSDSDVDLGTTGVRWKDAYIDTITTTSTITAAGRVIVDDATEATSTTDGSLQTDGGLSVAKSAVIGDDLDLLSNGAILNIGSAQKFTATHANANNTLTITADHRLAFGDAGDYIAGDGTDLSIVSSGAANVSATGVAIGAGSGELDLTTTGTLDVNANALDMDLTDSSNITITSSEAAEDLTIEQVGGNDSSIIIQAAGTGDDAIKLNATAGSIDIDAAAAKDVTINGGQIIVTAAHNVASAIKLHADAGSSQTIEIINDEGTATGAEAEGAILIESTVGGIGLHGADDKRIWAEAGEVVVTANNNGAAAIKLHADAGANQTIQLLNDAGTASTAIDIEATAGGFSIDGVQASNMTVTSAGAGDDLTISQAGANDSSVIITAAGTGTDAIKIDATAGDMLIAPSLANGKTLKIGPNGATEMVFTPHGTAASEKISLTNTAGTADDAISIVATAGGVTVQAGNDSLVLDADGTDADAINIDSAGGIDIDAAGDVDINADSFTVVTDAVTFTDSNSGKPVVTLKSTNTTKTTSAELKFMKDATGEDDEMVGRITFFADNDADQEEQFAEISCQIVDASDGAEAGKLSFGIACDDGNMITALEITEGQTDDDETITTIQAPALGVQSVTATGNLSLANSYFAILNSHGSNAIQATLPDAAYAGKIVVVTGLTQGGQNSVVYGVPTGGTVTKILANGTAGLMLISVSTGSAFKWIPIGDVS